MDFFLRSSKIKREIQCRTKPVCPPRFVAGLRQAGRKNMSKKFCGLFVLIFLFASAASASVDGRVPNSTAQERFKIVLFRGLLNLVGLPLELKRTAVLEKKIYPKAWSFTVVPRMLTNVFFRSASAANDTLFFPWCTLFTDDLSPWTEAMGLPEYPWEKD